MRFLTLSEVLEIHWQVAAASGGGVGILDFNALQSALAQPRVTFDGTDLYPDLIEKASALGFSLVMNHPFIDGNKRTGHAAMETFLMLNGFEITAPVDDQESIVLRLAASELRRDEFTHWLRASVVKVN